MRNYVQDGVTLTGVAPRALTSGEGAIVGANLFGVASAALANAAAGEFVVGPCVVELTALGTDTAAVGALAYWDNVNFRVTTTAAGNRLIGNFAAAKANGQTTAQVRLDGVAR
jgi:predicted RecA/RadA family phage recombinase